MSYFNENEIYVSGTNRIPGSKEDKRPLNDNYVQIIEITSIEGESIYFNLIARHPDCEIDDSSIPRMFYYSESNELFFKKLSDPILLNYTHYLFDLLFRGSHE